MTAWANEFYWQLISNQQKNKSPSAASRGKTEVVGATPTTRWVSLGNCNTNEVFPMRQTGELSSCPTQFPSGLTKLLPGLSGHFQTNGSSGLAGSKSGRSSTRYFTNPNFWLLIPRITHFAIS